MVSSAFVAVTLHVPTELTVRVSLVIEQPDAVPALVMAKESAPVPEPPEVRRRSGVPYLLVVVVIVNAPWFALSIVRVAVS